MKAEQTYPQWKYHAEKPALIVYSAEEHEALGEGWVDSFAELEHAIEATHKKPSKKAKSE